MYGVVSVVAAGLVVGFILVSAVGAPRRESRLTGGGVGAEFWA